LAAPRPVLESAQGDELPGGSDATGLVWFIGKGELPAIDGGDDFVGVSGPDEGFGVVVGLGDEVVDGGLKPDDGAKDAALEAPPGELGKKLSTALSQEQEVGMK